ncbi:hypothetical protein Bca4012_056961 [Brassica carinata]
MCSLLGGFSFKGIRISFTTTYPEETWKIQVCSRTEDPSQDCSLCIFLHQQCLQLRYCLVILELISDKRALDPSFSSNIVMLSQGTTKEVSTNALWETLSSRRPGRGSAFSTQMHCR